MVPLLILATMSLEVIRSPGSPLLHRLQAESEMKIWAANSVKHCTLPAIEKKPYTRMAMSVQVNRTTLNTCRDIKNGSIYLRKTYLKKKNLYFGGHRSILSGIVNRKS
ncbi:hypothetical protein PSTT_16163 [Puccinia striiformis]|uniref:Uncharacterized protein n=1 Tax=Puccinia striiformis TaxID=27350 RepID=A0A2S4UE45_9BASI|nr:hypothetical protein PSTT_16163 [Puccinia striiformis]